MTFKEITSLLGPCRNKLQQCPLAQSGDNRLLRAQFHLAPVVLLSHYTNNIVSFQVDPYCKCHAKYSGPGPVFPGNEEKKVDKEIDIKY